jgi:hypothetical protein
MAADNRMVVEMIRMAVGYALVEASPTNTDG